MQLVLFPNNCIFIIMIIRFWNLPKPKFKCAIILGKRLFLSLLVTYVMLVLLNLPYHKKRRSKGVIVERLKVDVPQPHYSDGLLLDLASSWLNTSSLLAFCRSPSWRTRLIRGGDSYFELITYLLLLKYYYNYCWGKTILHTARKYMRYF